MTSRYILTEWLSQTDQTNFKEGHYFVIEEAMKEYTRLKCQELLEIVAEKAKVGSDWKYKGGDSNILGNYTKTLVYKVNKNSILNAVDLEKFCS